MINLLNADVLALAIDAVAILAIILLGALVITIMSDLLLLVFSPNSNGVIFNRRKKNKKQPKVENEVIEPAPVVNEPAPVVNNITITPLSEINKIVHEDTAEDNYSIDYEKAIQEQKLLQEKLNNRVVSIPSVIEDEDDDISLDDDDDEEINSIILEVQQQALKEINDEDDARHQEPVSKKVIEDIVEEQLEEIVVEKPKTMPKRKVLTPKIIYKTTTVVQEEPQLAKQEVAKHNIKEDEFTVEELRKIREDIFDLRLSIFNDTYSNVKNTHKNQVVEKNKEMLNDTNKESVAQLEELIVKKLSELNLLAVKQNNLVEKEPEIIKEIVEVENTTKIDALTNEKLKLESESTMLKKERENLQKELNILRSSVGIDNPSKPIYSKTYYENRVLELEEELKQANKDLRINNREFNPLKRIKRSFDKDSVKLRRKEALVAKQKVSIYGVNNSDNIDPEKVEKLNEEVDALRKLKDSVYHCEQVLKQNKDRYPVLEKTNTILTRHIKTLERELEESKNSLTWFEENAQDGDIEN